MTLSRPLTEEGYLEDLAEAVTNNPTERTCLCECPPFNSSFTGLCPGYFSILRKPVGPSGSPFSIYKFGNAELSPAWGVGTLNRRVAGDVIAHVLHQLFQLGACRKKRAVRLGGLTPDEPGD